MAITPVQTTVESTITKPPTTCTVHRVRPVPLVRRAAAEILSTAVSARSWLQQRQVSLHAAADGVTKTWWDGVDWALRQPFEWAVTRARLDVLAYRWDLEGRADRLRAWASALEALAHARRALRDHPDIPEEDGVVERLENQALLLRAVAAADRTWFLRSQEETPQDELHERSPSTPSIEAMVGKHLDLLSSITTSPDERIVLLAQMKVLLAPTLGATAVQVLHDVS